MDFEYFLSKITDFFKKVLRISKKGITLQSFPMRTSCCQGRPEGLTRRNVIGVWRSWLAHLVWDQRVLCSSHSTPTKEIKVFDFGLFFMSAHLRAGAVSRTEDASGGQEAVHSLWSRLFCGPLRCVAYQRRLFLAPNISSVPEKPVFYTECL